MILYGYWLLFGECVEHAGGGGGGIRPMHRSPPFISESHTFFFVHDMTKGRGTKGVAGLFTNGDDKRIQGVKARRQQVVQGDV